MLNKKTLSLKMNKVFQQPPLDAPFTPVDQTLSTPIDPPNQTLYFPPPPSFYSNPQCNESDDILTDVDEPLNRVMRSYSVTFTPVFDQLVLGIYSHILSLPTTTPFSGTIPPSGLVSRVANETIHSLIKNSSEPQPVYDSHNMLCHDHLKNQALQPIILQLIRKRLLDLCSLQHRSSSLAGVPQATSVQVSVPVQNGLNGQAPQTHLNGGATPLGQLSQPYNQSPANANPLAVYNGLGLRQLLISNLLLNEQNVSTFQSQQLALAAQAAQVAALNNSRSRLSSLSLRKHSLTRNNSYSGSNWLHVGNVQNIRPNAPNSLGMNPEFAASNESLQLMHDFVPQAFIQRLANLLANLNQSAGNWGPQQGFNSMMLDYQTPPSSAKSSILLGSTPPSVLGNRDPICLNGSTAAAEYEEFTQQLMRSRSSSRGNAVNGLFPKPLTINTEASNFLLNMNNAHGNYNGNGMNGGLNGGLGETLNSPFVSATTPLEDVGYFGAGSLTGGSVLPGLHGLRNGPLIPESPGKEVPITNGNNKINLPGQFSLSEKKRDSLKLKRGIH